MPDFLLTDFETKMSTQREKLQVLWQSHKKGMRMELTDTQGVFVAVAFFGSVGLFRTLGANCKARKRRGRFGGFHSE